MSNEIPPTPTEDLIPQKPGVEIEKNGERTPNTVEREVPPEIVKVLLPNNDPNKTLTIDDPRAGTLIKDENETPLSPQKDRLQRKRPLLTTLPELIRTEELSKEGVLWHKKVEKIATATTAIFGIKNRPKLSERAALNHQVLSNHFNSFLNTGEKKSWSTDPQSLTSAFKKITRIAFCIDPREKPTVQARITQDVLVELGKLTNIPFCEEDLRILNQIKDLLQSGFEIGKRSPEMRPALDIALQQTVEQAIQIMISIISTDEENKNEEYQTELKNSYNRLSEAHQAPIRNERQQRAIIRLKRYDPSISIEGQRDFADPFEALGFDGTNSKEGEHCATKLWHEVLILQKTIDRGENQAQEKALFEKLCQLSGHIIQMFIEEEGIHPELRESLNPVNVDFKKLAEAMFTTAAAEKNAEDMTVSQIKERICNLKPKHRVQSYDDFNSSFARLDQAGLINNGSPALSILTKIGEAIGPDTESTNKTKERKLFQLLSFVVALIESHEQDRETLIKEIDGLSEDKLQALSDMMPLPKRSASLRVVDSLRARALSISGEIKLPKKPREHHSTARILRNRQVTFTDKEDIESYLHKVVECGLLTAGSSCFRALEKIRTWLNDHPEESSLKEAFLSLAGAIAGKTGTSSDRDRVALDERLGIAMRHDLELFALAFHIKNFEHLESIHTIILNEKGRTRHWVHSDREKISRIFNYFKRGKENLETTAKGTDKDHLKQQQERYQKALQLASSLIAAFHSTESEERRSKAFKDWVTKTVEKIEIEAMGLEKTATSARELVRQNAKKLVEGLDESESARATRTLKMVEEQGAAGLKAATKSEIENSKGEAEEWRASGEAAPLDYSGIFDEGGALDFFNE
jgi:hypothetical protein